MLGGILIGKLFVEVVPCVVILNTVPDDTSYFTTPSLAYDSGTKTSLQSPQNHLDHKG